MIIKFMIFYLHVIGMIFEVILKKITLQMLDLAWGHGVNVVESENANDFDVETITAGQLQETWFSHFLYHYISSGTFSVSVFFI